MFCTVNFELYFFSFVFIVFSTRSTSSNICYLTLVENSLWFLTHKQIS